MGKTRDDETGLFLFDREINTRLRACVDSAGNPKLEFLDRNGKMIYSLPEDKKLKKLKIIYKKVCKIIRKPGMWNFKLIYLLVFLSMIYSANAQQQTKFKILFTSFDSKGKGDIYIINSDGTGLKKITSGDSTNMLSSWSPDIRKITFRGFQDGNPEIYTIDVTGNNLKRLTEENSDDCNPKWSPDGNWIVFESLRDGDVGLYLMDTAGKNIKRLTNAKTRSLNASWSPDGRKITFVSMVDHNYEICIMNIKTGKIERITNTSTWEKFPVWSPDGKKIAFVSERNNVQGIYIMNADGTAAHLLIEKGINPDWFPDNSGIVFTIADKNSTGLFMININGSGLKKITKDDIDVNFPVCAHKKN